MGILSFRTDGTANAISGAINLLSSEAGFPLNPGRVFYIVTTDDIDTITTSGYIDRYGVPYNLNNADIALVVYDAPSFFGFSANSKTRWFQIAVTGSASPYTYSLVEITGYA